MLRWLTDRRRRHLRELPFPDAWDQILATHAAVFALFDDAERARLRELVQVFVAEKRFEGCGGLEITDEIRVTIAAMACVLLLARDHDLFDDVETILVYPSTIALPAAGISVRGRAAVQTHVRPAHGVAIRRGPVIFAWDAVVADTRDPCDGRNVVIHELARKIDFLDGIADGTPPLDRVARHAWTTTLQAAFDAQRTRADRGDPSLLRDDAIASPADYFAIASEMFFERPRDFARELPAVYAVFEAFYGLDLAARPEPTGAPYRGPVPDAGP